MSQEWYYSRHGQQSGPVDMAELQRLAAAGELSPGDLLWKAPETAWIPAAQLPELAFPQTVTPAGSTALTTTPPILGYQDVIAPPGDVVASLRAIDMLRGTKPWVRFLSIFAFVLGGLMIVGAGGMSLAMSGGGGPGLAFALAMGGGYLALGLVHIALGIYLFRYASSIAVLLATNHSHHLEKALEAQRSFWRLAEIITIVILVLYFGGLATVALIAFRR